MDGCEKYWDYLTSARLLTISRPFPHNSTPVYSQQAARLLTTIPFFMSYINRLRGPESELKKKLNFSAVDNFCPVDNQRGCHGARCGQRVGPRHAHARSQTLYVAARRSRRAASGRRASRPIDSRPPAGVEQKADKEAGQTDAAPSPTPAAAWAVNALGTPYSGFREFSALRTPAKRRTALSRAQSHAAGQLPG